MYSKKLAVVTLLICALKFISTQMSCRGRCGAEYYRGNLCQCDNTCLSFEECCRDYESQCTTKYSCKGRCGEVFKRGRLCSCDPECSGFKQCCPDYKDHCDMDAITAEISGAATGPVKSSSCDNVHNNPKEPTLTDDPSFGEGNNAGEQEDLPIQLTEEPPFELSIHEASANRTSQEHWPQQPNETQRSSVTMNDNLYTPDSLTTSSDLSDDIIGEIFPGDEFPPNPEASPGPETSIGDGNPPADHLEKIPTEQSLVRDDPDLSTERALSINEPTPVDDIFTPKTTASTDQTTEPSATTTLSEPTGAPDLNISDPSASSAPQTEPAASSGDTETEMEISPSDKPEFRPTSLQDLIGNLENSWLSTTSASSTLASVIPSEETNSSSNIEGNPESVIDTTPDVVQYIKDPVSTLNPNGDGIPSSTAESFDVVQDIKDPVSTLKPNGDGLPSSTAVNPGSVIDSLPDVVQDIKDPVSILNPNGDGLPSSTAVSPGSVIDSLPDVVQDIKDPVSTLNPTGVGITSSTAGNPDDTTGHVKPDVTAKDPPTSAPDLKPTPSKASPTSKPETKPLEPQTQVTDNVRDYQGDDSYDTNLCSGRPVSGVTTLRNGTMVVFRGHFFWFLDTNLVPSPPRGITEVWGVPSPIDTVFTRCNCQGKTYIFKGGRYWRFENDALDPGYPKIVKTGFDGLQGHITAALSVPQYHSRKESVYFFKRGGTVQKYSYQFGTTPTCGRTAQVPVYSVRARMVRQAVSVLEPAINIRKTWKGFPSTITAAVSVPSRRDPEGYKYIVFSRSTAYNVRINNDRPVVTPPRANVSPKTNNFFRCPKKS